jgi:Asp-tRNA(Asn)/Glu-tRNA(Gln) amidotransferase A subunit family amidase
MLDPVYFSANALITAFRSGELTPTEVLKATLARIDRIDPALHAYLTRTDDLAREQAVAATKAYQRGESAPLLGVPVSVKDAFHISGVETTLGSLVHRGQMAKADSGVVRRLRAAGAVFTGKTNTAEFGQSATTDNLLGDDTANPWDPARTAGGSSGGAAASVAAGMATLAVGSDGGGSIRIPASFCGLVGLKPTPGLCPDEGGFRAMTEFVSPGPLARRVADARVMLNVLADRDYHRAVPRKGLTIAWSARPEGRPVEAGVARRVAAVADLLAAQGHHVEQRDLPIGDWPEIFGPLVLADEHRERGHLLMETPDRITAYERATLRAARDLDPSDVDRASRMLPEFRRRIAALFTDVDLILTPTVAVPAFPLGQRPNAIDGESVSTLWGAFPFAVPFNVAGTPALTVPCGLSDGVPVGAQLVAAPHRDHLLLDVGEELEEAIGFDSTPVIQRWSAAMAGAIE